MPLVRSVSKYPGATQFTRTPLPAQSNASERVIASTPPLAAQYAADRARPTCPAIEVTLTMLPPPCASMRRPNTPQHRNTPVRFTSMISCHSDRAVCSDGL